MTQNIVEILLRAKDESQPALKSYTAGMKQMRAQVEELRRIQADAARSVVTAASPTDSIASRADLKKVTEDLKVAEGDLNSVTGALGGTAGRTSGSFRELFTSFTAANLAAGLIQQGIAMVRQGLSDSVNAATNYQNAMAGLSVTAQTFGESQTLARDRAKSLSADGLVAVTTSASGLKQLMDSGLGLDQATQLMEIYKDRAAFGRSETIGYDQAVGNLAETFKTESSELGNMSGMTENYSQILAAGAAQMGKNVSQLDSAERAQAKYLGTIQLSTAATGNAARFADSYAGDVARAATASTNFQVIIGSALQPALQLLRQGFTETIEGANGTGDSIKYVQMYLATFAALVRGIAMGVVSAAQMIMGALQSIFTLSWQPLIDATNQTVDRTVSTWTDWQDSISEIAAGTADVQVSEQGRALGAMTQAQRTALDRMREQLAEENLSYQRSNEARTQQFQESMRDMVISHRDKSRSLQRDIADENAAYAEQTADRQKALNEDLLSMEEGHADKVADINRKMADERSKGLVVDGVLYAEANQEKLDELQADLDEETRKYQRQVDKRRATYDEDVAADQARHAQKLSQLQTEMDAELAILNTHREQVAAVGEAQKEDDLSRMIRQNQEAIAIADRDHTERLAKIRAQATEQGGAAGSSYAGGVLGAINAGTPALNAAMGNMGGQMGSSFADAMKNSMNQKAGGFDFTSWAQTVFGKMGEALAKVRDWYKGTDWGRMIDAANKWQGDAAAGIANFFGLNTDTARRAIEGRATGGPVSAGQPYVVGEREPELFVPGQSGAILNGEQIRSAIGGSGGGPAIHIENVNNYTQVDWSAFSERMAWGATR